MNGEVALVTGSSLGIGKATAETLAAQGANIILNYFSEADKEHVEPTAIENAVSAVAKHGVKVLAYDADVSDRRNVTSLVQAGESEFGKIDILVNNAGTHLDGHYEFVATPEHVYDRMLAVNLKGVFLVAQAVVPGMISRNKGKIVNISSEIGIVGGSGLTAYSASKAGVIGLTKSMAKELSKYNITVNCICPGPVETLMLSDYERTEEYYKTVPLGRLGRPEEIAGAVLFLVSPVSDWTTGQTFSPNGGVVI